MAKSYHHLTLPERVLIETQLSLGLRPGLIAASLLRARSTVTWEIRRNGWRGLRRWNPLRVDGQYRALPAARRRTFFL